MRPGAPRGGRPGGIPGGQPGQPGQPSAAAAAAMAGAIDLGALKARNEAAARAAEAPAPTAGDYVFDVTEAGFQADVGDRSFQVPVLLVLTSTRAPSGDQLAASLEAEIAKRGGAVLLGRVDADANPRIVQLLQAQAVPATYAVIAGQVVPGFQGAIPDEQIRDFLDAVVKAGAENGLSGAVDATADGTDGDQDGEPEPPADPRFTAAEDALEAGDLDLAAERYDAVLAEEPANEQARLALGQVRLLQRLQGVDTEAAARADSSPADVDAQLAAADIAIAGNDVQGALDRLLRTVTATAGDDRDRVRQRLLELFDLLGPDDPRVPAARRQLTRALF